MGVAVLLMLPHSALAAPNTWEYRITEIETVINEDKTSAVVDTENREIRLPKFAPKVAAFWGDECLDYVVLKPGVSPELVHYSFDGATMIENTILGVSLTNPLAAFTSSPYPDVIVAEGTEGGASKLTHYSFTGEGMQPNPALSATGLTSIFSIGSRNLDWAYLNTEGLHYRAFDGAGMVEVGALSVTTGLTNPIDFALFPDNYDCVILDGTQSRYYNAGTPIATHTVQGAKSVAAGNEGNIAIVEGSQVKHYDLSGGSFSYVAALSITEGLTRPTAVALRPGSQDRLIVDGDDVKYFMYDGSAGLVYNPSLSVTVAGLQDMGKYLPSAIVQSTLVSHTIDVTHVRARAYHAELPRGTSVTWAVTADGDNWTTKWRVIHPDEDGSAPMLQVGDGESWETIGDASKAYPNDDTVELWAEVTPGQDIGWRATLATLNPDNTPRIVINPVDDNVAVRWDVNSRPEPPTLIAPGSCYTTTTPTLQWTFNDPDLPNDFQSAFRLVILKASDDTVVWNTGKVTSSDLEYTIPTSYDPDIPGLLWDTGTYQFKARIEIWDKADVKSEMSADMPFCIRAFERPRVTGIIGAPDHLPVVITPNMTDEQLPRTQAGAKVTLLVDSVGPDNLVLAARFPYLDKEAELQGFPAKILDHGTNKRWQVEFWTEASLDVVPSGTLVDMELDGHLGEGGALGTRLSTLGATPFGDPKYAAGVIVTDGSIYHSWFVVLQGRDE